MPKIKTHKATAKRLRYSGKGKLMRTKVGKSHFRRRKPKRVKVLFSRMLEVESVGYRRKVKRLAPYLDK
jgi:large subunit ribosomal protein L35